MKLVRNLTQMEETPAAPAIEVIDNVLTVGRIRQAVDILLAVRCPIVVNMHKSGTSELTKSMEIYVGDTFPLLRVAVNADTISQGGLGDLMADPELPKLLEGPERFNSDTAAILKMFSILGFRPAAVVNLQMAFKMLDYLERGQCLSFIPDLPVNQWLGELGIDLSPNASSEDKMRKLMVAYFYFHSTLPPFALNYLKAGFIFEHFFGGF